MKKLFLVLILVFVSLSIVSAETISWKWRSNDSEVKYYRYRVDEGEWNTVGNESFEVKYDLDSSISHIFSIEQSYDGLLWSETAVREYVPIVEEVKAKELRAYSKSTFRFNVIPQENVTIRNANSGISDFYAEYAYGLEANGTLYLNKLLGFGLSFTYNSGKRYLGIDDWFFNMGLYIVPAIRIVSNNTLEVALKGGVGIEIEPYEGVNYIAQSFIAQIDASVFITSNFSIAISPGIVYSMGDFLTGSDYNNYTIRIINVGASWNF